MLARSDYRGAPHTETRRHWWRWRCRPGRLHRL